MEVQMQSDWAAYETVLRDLRAKKVDIDRAIAAIEALRPASTNAPLPGEPEHAPLTVVAASMKALADEDGPLHVAELLKRITALGVKMNSEDPANTLGSILNRRRKQKGDVLRVSRGTWALAKRVFKFDVHDHEDADLGL
jgi:hypothetical protein